MYSETPTERKANLELHDPEALGSCDIFRAPSGSTLWVHGAVNML